MDATPIRWVLFSYSVPKNPSTVRVGLWRRLRDLGAMYIAPSVCVIPETPETVRRLQTFRALPETVGGTIRLFTFVAPDPETEQGLQDQFQALRTAEYAEFKERAQALLDELRREGEGGKFTFAELEENEDELEKLERWLKRIEARDLLDCPERSPSTELLEQGRAALAEFRAVTVRRELEVQDTIPEVPGLEASLRDLDADSEPDTN